jgi:predicted nucleotidyltransferase component of viral defense system
MMASGSSSLSDKPSLQELLEVQSHFGLPSPALVEKDWYVVKALKAISTIDAPPFRLVFGGGTALSRAHRLIQRMSEDIDLKIVSGVPITRPALRHLRDAITKALLETGFVFDPSNPAHGESGNASRYTLYRLPYTPVAEGQGSLRPEIQIDTAVWPLRRPAPALPVTSFVAEAFHLPPEVPAIPCAAIVETVAEKFVALTRRAGAELADAGGPRDPTLVRHVYDLHMLRAHYNATEAAILVQTIMGADIEAYGHQFPAYRDNPIAETLRAVAGMSGDPGFARRYTSFLRDMVYGDTPNFETALSTVASLARRLEPVDG